MRVSIKNISTNEPDGVLPTGTKELTISGTSTDDASSNYSCRATNNATIKEVSEVFELFVQGKFRQM